MVTNAGGYCWTWMLSWLVDVDKFIHAPQYSTSGLLVFMRLVSIAVRGLGPGQLTVIHSSPYIAPAPFRTPRCSVNTLIATSNLSSLLKYSEL